MNCTKNSCPFLSLRLHLQLQRIMNSQRQVDVSDLVSVAHHAPGLTASVDSDHDEAAQTLSLLVDVIHSNLGNLSSGGGLVSTNVKGKRLLIALFIVRKRHAVLIEFALFSCLIGTKENSADKEHFLLLFCSHYYHHSSCD